MFKIFIVIFLASGGPPVGHSSSKWVADAATCQTRLTSTDVNDNANLIAFKNYAEAMIGSEVKLAAACVEVDANGDAVDASQIPSDEALPQEQ